MESGFCIGVVAGDVRRGPDRVQAGEIGLRHEFHDAVAGRLRDRESRQCSSCGANRRTLHQIPSLHGPAPLVGRDGIIGPPFPQPEKSPAIASPAPNLPNREAHRACATAIKEEGHAPDLADVVAAHRGGAAPEGLALRETEQGLEGGARNSS